MEKSKTGYHEKFETSEMTKQPPRQSIGDEAWDVPKSSRYENRMKFKKRDARRGAWDDDED
ncbi:MAG: hypothetical protein EP340_06385 [Alphaproteobacteria bacterium]|nr:MAG: hypothetical protein EP340_06385 [Alphaproteobacteria bacterium]